MATRNGRPPKLSKEKIEEIKILLADYMDREKIPIIADFCYKYDIDRDHLYNYEEFYTLRRKLINKKESALEHGALLGDLNSSMSIFSLKQMGWTDKKDIKQELSGEVKLELDYESCRKIAEKLKKE